MKGVPYLNGKMKRQQNHQLLSLVDAAYKDISAWLWQDELYKATLDNCTTEKGWVRNIGQNQADEHQAQEYRVPHYLKDLQKGNPWMEETMIDNFNDFHPEENSGMILHQHRIEDVVMDGVDVVAEEGEH